MVKMRAQGHSLETVKDESAVAFISAFESSLPLGSISLNEFERRLKKLVTPKMQDKISVRMVVECFKDHWAFADILKDQSLTRELMFDEVFLYKADDGVDEADPGAGIEPDDDEEMIEVKRRMADLNRRLVLIPRLLLLGILYCPSNRK